MTPTPVTLQTYDGKPITDGWVFPFVPMPLPLPDAALGKQSLLWPPAVVWGQRVFMLFAVPDPTDDTQKKQTGNRLGAPAVYREVPVGKLGDVVSAAAAADVKA